MALLTDQLTYTLNVTAYTNCILLENKILFSRQKAVDRVLAALRKKKTNARERNMYGRLRCTFQQFCILKVIS
jgi:hypothetical protein